MKRLYLIMRTDLASMTTGRIAAQAAHAANQFVFEHEYIKNEDGSVNPDPEVAQWQSEEGTFGTTIVLNGGSEKNIQDIVSALRALGVQANITVDPEYMLRDGDFVHTVPNVLTGAYAFTEPGNIVLSALNLL